jgi:hypothetical protein
LAASPEYLGMNEDWLDYLLSHLGEPRPCAMCGTPTRPADLTEGSVPCKVLDFGVPGLRATDPDPVIARRVIWVCPACPVP